MRRGTNYGLHPVGPGPGPALLYKAQLKHDWCNPQAYCMGDTARSRAYCHSKLSRRPLHHLPESAYIADTYFCAVDAMMRVAVYDNKIEKNVPYGICGPITCSDDCVKDNITVHYFDSAPFKTGLRDPCCQENDCACIPMTCCGPPVIFSHRKQYCCGLCCCASCEGAAIRSTPCSVWNCKTYIICGKPCYLEYAEDFFELPLTCATPPSVVFSLSPRVY